MKKISCIIFLSAFFSNSKIIAQQNAFPNDEHSFSNPQQAVVKHLDLTIKVDFKGKTITGKATWLIDNISRGNEIIFDDNNLFVEKNYIR